MTQSVGDKAQFPAKVWRRHTDPPGLWLGVVIGSVILHLIALGILVRYYSLKISLRQPNQNSIPVEFVEIPQQGRPQKPASKPISITVKRSAPQPTVREQKLTAEPVTRTQPRIIEDTNAIALERAKPTSRQNNQSPVVAPQPTPTPTQTFTPEPTPTQTFTPEPQPTQTFTPEPQPTQTFTPEPTPTQTFTPEPTPTQTFTPEPTPTGNYNPAQPGGSISTGNPTPLPTLPGNYNPRQPGDRITTGNSTPLPTISPTVDPNQPPITQTGRGLIANWVPIPEEDQRQAIGRDLTDILPQLIPSSNPQEFLPIPLDEFKIEPRKFFAVLVIDSEGNFQLARILPKGISVAEIQKYQPVVQKIFAAQNLKFSPGTNKDGSKPPLSNLVVEINIEYVDERRN
jgi:hypothetical protein